MPRQLVIALALLFAPGVALAQPGGSIEETTGDGDDELDASGGDELDAAAGQEIGGALGFEAGGRVSPGGLQLTGYHMFRLSDVDWLESSVAFTVGGAGGACFRDRQDVVICDHGLVNGLAGEVAIGIRRFLADYRQDRFIPFARVGVGARFVNFSTDEVRGVAIPAIIGGGVRARLTHQFALSAGATARAGIAFMNKGLGAQPHFTFSIQFAAEFALE